MRLVLYSHPDFIGSQSMPRFAISLAQAYRARGHEVELRSPRARLRRLVTRGPLAKWAGYVDQYILFPVQIVARLRRDPADTLYVFCDQALGPWVPFVRHRPHVVHCHDLLALRSALGQIPENPTGFTGRVYQRYIRAGFRRARHFISVSRRSKEDLETFGNVSPVTSEVVYNGLNYPYTPMDADEADRTIRSAGLPEAPDRMLLHVSGAQWYKNAAGVVRLYAHYARRHSRPLPLWLVGVKARGDVAGALAEVPAQGRVHHLFGLDNEVLRALYSRSRALLFPSLAEGFGWPIIEAMACGCPVITTDDSPMNEVGGTVAKYLPLLHRGDDVQAWAAHGADVLEELLDTPSAQLQRLSEEGRAWVERFNTDAAMDGYLRIYAQILDREGPRGTDRRTTLG